MSADAASSVEPRTALAQVNGTTSTTTMSPELREQLRVEFFRTYDMMTGVRIAATLGGFFGMMVLLVLYKSRCRPRKTAIKEVRLAAAKAVVEEEDQQEAVAAAIYMQTVVTGRVPRRSLGALSAPVGPAGAWGPPGAGAGLSPRGSVAYSIGGGGPLGAGHGPHGLVPRAAFLRGGRPASLDEDALDPVPLPVRFSSLSGCSLLDAKVAISSVRRASMLPNPPTRHLHQRLHLHQQRHQQHRRESKLLQDQRLDLLRPRLQAAPPPGPGSPSASLAGSLAALGPPCPAGPAIRTRDAAKPKGGGRARSASLHAGAGGAAGGQGQGQGQGQAPPGGRRHSQARAARKALTGGPGQGLSPFHPRGAFALRTPLGVIDSSPELAGSPAGSMASMGSQACPRGGPPPPPPPPPGAGALSADANDSNSSSCLVLPYGAPCESFELAEIAYGEAAAPLARIATLETASIRDGDGVLDSGSDSVFGVPPTQHGQAPDTADQADTGVDTGQDADTDQDADGQLSTDSNGSGSSTPHQVVRHKPRLYVLPVGMAPVSG
ncbi:uncharacterized protein LOC113207962 isoform X2 [Frankliniella occidentalis]|uniref:Uncharacterized protein LOC113207962 isoform X2 n=1 Tax=Frankliniella occidentalis TaxID=133901 RepID=A0A9C6X403_FRAOC|nr:uncharacterized protein LOC113207962 isoform X2 [Frankliniella occidentalis]